MSQGPQQKQYASWGELRRARRELTKAMQAWTWRAVTEKAGLYPETYNWDAEDGKVQGRGVFTCREARLNAVRPEFIKAYADAKRIELGLSRKPIRRRRPSGIAEMLYYGLTEDCGSTEAERQRAGFPQRLLRNLRPKPG